MKSGIANRFTSIKRARANYSSNFHSYYAINYVETQNILTNSIQEGGTSCYRSYEQSISTNNSSSFIVIQKCNFHWRRSHDHGGTSWCEEWVVSGNIKNFSVTKTSNDSDGGYNPGAQSDPGALDVSSFGNNHVSVSFNKNNLNGNYTQIFSKTLREDIGQWYYKIFAKISGSTITVKYEFQMLNSLTDGWRDRSRLSWFSRSAIVRS